MARIESGLSMSARRQAFSQGARADVAADGRHRVRVAGQDVALFETALGGKHQVAAAIRVDRAAFLALDIALEPVDADFGGLEPQRDGVCGDHWHRRRAGSTTSCRQSEAAANRWYPSRASSVKAIGAAVRATTGWKAAQHPAPGPPSTPQLLVNAIKAAAPRSPAGEVGRHDPPHEGSGVGAAGGERDAHQDGGDRDARVVGRRDGREPRVRIPALRFPPCRSCRPPGCRSRRRRGRPCRRSR